MTQRSPEAGLGLGSREGRYAPALDLALATGALALAVLLCLPALGMLSFLWKSDLFYGHAFAMPPAALYLVLANRRALAAGLRELEPPPWGAAAVLAAGLFELAMVMGDVVSLAGLGIPLLLGSVAWALGGARLLRPLLLPLAILALMVPPPGSLVNAILFRLKLVVTDSAVSILQAMGQPVLAEGNRIVLPQATLFVVDACSGLTSIVTLLPLAVLVAWFASRGVWRRAAVLASMVPLAMGANIARVVVTTRLVSTHGVAFAEGLLHESFGLATSVLGTLALLGVARALR
jgi:exosortase